MKKTAVGFLLAITVLLLTACEPYSGDPYVAMKSAGAAIQRTELAAATQQAERSYQERMQSLQATADIRIQQDQVTATSFAATLQESQAQSTAAARMTDIAVTAEANVKATNVEADRVAVLDQRNRQATKDMAGVYVYQTQQAIIARSDQLALQREENWNAVRAAAPWVTGGLLFILVVGLVIVAVTHEIKRPKQLDADERGDKPLLQLESRSKVTIIDPDKNPTGVTEYDKQTGQVTYPQLVPPDWQRAHAQNDQMLDLVHRGLAGQRGMTQAGAQRLLQGMGGAGQDVQVYEIIGPNERPAYNRLPKDTLEILEAEWKEVE